MFGKQRTVMFSLFQRSYRNIKKVFNMEATLEVDRRKLFVTSFFLPGGRKNE